MRLFFSCLFFINFLAFAHAQHVSYMDAEISADGRLDEEVWNSIEPFSQFNNFWPINEGQATFDTDVRVFQDGEFLNIAFVYHDSSAVIRVNSLKRDNYFSGFHLSDCIGVVIDPYGNQNRGYFFSVNGEGAQLDALIANFDNRNLSWDAIWQSGQGVEGTKKIYELKIPLSVFSYDENISEWSFQFYTRDVKHQMYTVWNKFDRSFLQFDTRFLKPIEMVNLEPSKTSRATIIPALTSTYTNDIETKEDEFNVQASLDLQYKISDGLRIDATINPDFSQVDVDEQVTNLTRFNIVFPERRNFFIENSDIFSTLESENSINPFYSRFIGASQDILMGLKLSGNVSPNTRIGLLNVQSKKEEDVSQNYTVAVAKQQFGKVFNTTAYLVNRQRTEGLAFQDDYNRVTGLKANYLSLNKKWAGFATYGASFNDNLSGDNKVASVDVSYLTRSVIVSSKLNTVGKNYLTDIGFVPRLNQFDALNNTSRREGYTHFYQLLNINHFPKNKDVIQSMRFVNADVNVYWDETGDLNEVNYFNNFAVFFTNQMSVYANFYHDDIKLKYAFEPLRDGYLILADEYANTALRLGFNSDFTRSLYGSINGQFGSFYEGERSRIGTTLGYRFLPLINFELNYEYNAFQFDEVEKRDLHLLGLTAEVFFNNKLNWTTYVQYNEQAKNFNINSRLQWEYKPLSFVYFVFSDNSTEQFNHTNYSFSFKINRRLNY